MVDHPGEDELLGTQAAHRGSDLYRRWLALHPREIQRIQDARPDGPLAVSYQLGNGPVRYDHCWATPEIHVERIDYVQEAFRYSDHAAIVADLNVHPNGKQAVRIPIDDIEPDWMGQPAIQIDDSDLDTLWGGAS